MYKIGIFDSGVGGLTVLKELYLKIFIIGAGIQRIKKSTGSYRTIGD